jgi:hypothetical protein
MTDWPTAHLDPVRQLRVLAEVLPGVGLIERVLDAPYERVWSFLADLERSVPAFDPMVRSLRVVSRDGEHLIVATRMPHLPIPLRFQVELRDGWCLMRSRTYLVGMAAAPLAGGRTCYAHLEGLPIRRLPVLRPLRPLFRWVVTGDVNGIIGALGPDGAADQRGSNDAQRG